MLYISHREKETKVLGPGKRYAIWLQGCRKHCKGCLFPEGIMKTDEILLFDHNQIAKIYHFGLSDEEEKKFKQDLEKALEEEKSKKE